MSLCPVGVSKKHLSEVTLRVKFININFTAGGRYVCGRSAICGIAKFNYRVERRFSLFLVIFLYLFHVKMSGEKKGLLPAIRCVTRELSKPSQAEFGTLYLCRQMSYACLSLYTPDTLTS